jgi:glucose dehydrogenase
MITSRSKAFGCGGGRGAAHPILRPNRRIRLACRLALVFAFPTVAALADGAGASFPRTDTLLNAQLDNANWILPAKTYAGNRYTALTQIDKTNVGALGRAWRTDIADDGEQEASPLVWNGVMYLSTPHDGVLALDAGTGKLLWQAAYNPAYVLLFAVNRGWASPMVRCSSPRRTAA